MRRREYPALHGNPVPSVHHNRRAAVWLANAQAEEGVSLGLKEEDLHAATLQQTADIAHRYVWNDIGGLNEWP